MVVGAHGKRRNTIVGRFKRLPSPRLYFARGDPRATLRALINSRANSNSIALVAQDPCLLASRSKQIFPLNFQTEKKQIYVEEDTQPLRFGAKLQRRFCEFPPRAKIYEIYGRRASEKLIWTGK